MIEKNLRWFHILVSYYLRMNNMHLIKKLKSYCGNTLKVSVNASITTKIN